MTEIESLEKQKNNAYWERNQLVAAISKIFPAHLSKHPEEDEEWDDDWRNIVVVYVPMNLTMYKDSDKQPGDLPMTWHIHDHDMPMFDHLNYKEDYWWDGHSTEEKYKRLRLLQNQR